MYRKKKHRPAHPKSAFLRSADRIIIALLIIIMLLLVFIYGFFVRSKNLQLAREGQKIEKLFSEYLDYSNSLNVFIGRQIASHGAQDLPFILDLFKKVSNYNDKANQLFSKTNFGWIDDENRVLVDSSKGIAKEIEANYIPNLSYREYTQDVRKRPWTLQVSPPSIGNSSKMWVLPAATGITDDNGKFLGAIVLGIDVADLSRRIENVIDSNMDFMVLDKQFNLVVKNNFQPLNPGSYKSLLRNRGNTLLESSKFLDYPVRKDGVIYGYYRNFENYPYLVLMGYNRVDYYLEFLAMIAPALLSLILLILVIKLLPKYINNGNPTSQYKHK